MVLLVCLCFVFYVRMTREDMPGYNFHVLDFLPDQHYPPISCGNSDYVTIELKLYIF